MLVLLGLINDLEALYRAVDSACLNRCGLVEGAEFTGLGGDFIRSYLRVKYTGNGCVEEVNVLDARVVYEFNWIAYKRLATFRALLRGCNGLVEVKGLYVDRVPFGSLEAVRVEGVSPTVKRLIPPYFELLISSAIVVGVLYAFYTIGG